MAGIAFNQREGSDTVSKPICSFGTVRSVRLHFVQTFLEFLIGFLQGETFFLPGAVRGFDLTLRIH